MGIGLVVLALTRMYEGLLFAAPFVAALLLRCRSVRVSVPIAMVLAAGAAFTLQYNAPGDRPPRALPVHGVSEAVRLRPFVQHPTTQPGHDLPQSQRGQCLFQMGV
jgi:hypothetical protein